MTDQTTTISVEVLMDRLSTTYMEVLEFIKEKDRDHSRSTLKALGMLDAMAFHLECAYEIAGKYKTLDPSN